MSWCNEALCWYSKKETALLQEFGLTRSSWSGAGLAWEWLCVYMCAQAFFLMGKSRPNCPLHCLVLPDGFLKRMLESKPIPVCSLSFLFFFFTYSFLFFLFLPWKHGNDSCRIILMEGKKKN